MNKKMKSFFQYLGLGAATLAGGVGLGTGTFFLLDSIDQANSYLDGYKMIARNAHLKQGVHKIVLTNSFYDLLNEREPEFQDYAMNSLKEAYKDLNKYNTGIKFDIYTQNEGLLKYGIKKADEIDLKNDITLYLTKEKLGKKDSEGGTIAITKWSLDKSSRELQYESITMRDDFLFGFLKLNETWEETFIPSNSFTYPVLIHETMHCMGFEHRDTQDSIMYPSIGLTTPNKLTETDIKMLKTYNTTYYNEEIKTPEFTETTNTDEMEM